MPVRNWRDPVTEVLTFITPDGEEYRLNNHNNKMVLSVSGFGLPQPKFSTTQGPFQHGRTPTAIREQPRKIILSQYTRAGCRDDYWSNRLALVNALRRNRADVNLPEPGALRWNRSDGTIRQVDVYTLKGPVFLPFPNRRTPHSYEEKLQFIAYNPIIYDPEQQSIAQTGFATTSQAELQFPITFDATHIVFNVVASTTAIWNETLVYAGNWEEYPTITIAGPATNPLIQNLSTGLKIELDYSIANGETVTISLQYGTKTIINNFGTSLLGYLTTDSDLATFSLQPDPIVTDGNNIIQITTTFSTGATSVTLSYFNRYIGI
jgi:hypothetical protein